jgi:hypothetical protein
MAKITRYDRLMAIKRHPEFIKDYEKYKRYKNPSGQRALRKLVEIATKWAEEPEAILNAEKLKDTANPVKVATEIDYKRCVIICRDGDNIIPSVQPGGTLLYLEIDLRDTKKEILKGVERRIAFYKQAVPKDNRRKRQSKVVDIWDVYDLHRSGLNLNQIAKKLSGIRDNPSYNETLMNKYKAIERAFDKAQAMIDSIRSF